MSGLILAESAVYNKQAKQKLTSFAPGYLWIDKILAMTPISKPEKRNNTPSASQHDNNSWIGLNSQQRITIRWTESEDANALGP